MKITRRPFLIFNMVICIVVSCSAISPATAQLLNITNDRFWNTKDGKPIYSQGGGIFRFTDPVTRKEKYYWYGVHYKEGDVYRSDPSVTQSHSTFKSVTCYSSTDLVNWTFEGDVLTRHELEANTSVTWVGRLGVAYIASLRQYAMFVQCGGKLLVAVSDKPQDTFVWHQLINMQPLIGTSNTGDQTVFTDDDGKSYLIYSYGRGRNKVYVSEIGIKDGKIGLLDCMQVFRGESREGNCMFKYKGKYYMCASNIYGWDASYAYYMVADNIRGPYHPVNKMLVMDGCQNDYGHITQTGFFVTIKGSKQETVLFCGDRWCDFAGNGLGYNQWLPLSFHGDVPYFISLSSWNLDAVSGEWEVGRNNNYVKNGSFEADRNYIPSHSKPVQTELTGWKTEVTGGNKISLDSFYSPVLNHFNTKEERKTVTGEKSLNITDNADFKRKIYQVISSSPYIKLKNGHYTLSAMIKNGKGFNKLNMYAVTGSKTYTYDAAEEHTNWRKITLGNIPVTNGKVEIGFLANGKANAFCYVDDVSLVRAE